MVYSMDTIADLAEEAAKRLRHLQYENIIIRSGNGYHGWVEHAPYAGIIVTAAAPYIPEALVEQLQPGGRLVIPVGQQFMPQELMLVEKDNDGSIRKEKILGVAFVPLVDRST